MSQVLSTTGSPGAAQAGPLGARRELLKTLRDSKRYPEALVIAAGLLTENPDDAMLHRDHADLLRRCGRLDEALAGLDRAEALSANLPGLDARRGLILIEAGRMDEAETMLRRSIGRRRDLGRCYYRLALAGRTSDADAGAIAELLTGDVSDDEQVSLNFALGIHLDRQGKHPGAFHRFAEANRTRARGKSWNREQAEGVVATHKKAATPALFSNGAERHRSDKPVFITGLPRSGTTLVEQIFAAHPDVYPGGERETLNDMASALRGNGQVYPAVLGIIGGDTPKRLGMQYLSSLPPDALDFARVTDKLPGNLLHAPLIRLIFPKAAIIHCRRHPLDICLSMYSQHFEEAGDYLSNLESLARTVALMLDMAEHFHGILPDPPLEVFYERLVSDLEPEVRRIVDFVGLPWDDRCLRPHESERSVATASAAQVRRPVYASSVGRWRNYAKELEPARIILADAIEAYEARLTAA